MRLFTSLDPGGNVPQNNVVRRFAAGAQVGPDAMLASPPVFIPNLTCRKSVVRPTGSVPGGATVDFLIRLRNTGTLPAYDIAALVDTLDPGLTFVNAFQSDASCQTTTPVPGVSASGQTVTIPVTVNPLPHGANYYVCLRATLFTGASPATPYVNRVVLGTGSGDTYFTAPPSFSGRRGFAHYPQAQAPVITRPVTTQKVEISGGPSADGTAVPGELVDYELRFTIPAGTTLYSPVVRDTFNFAAAPVRLAPPTNITPSAPTLTCVGAASAATPSPSSAARRRGPSAGTSPGAWLRCARSDCKRVC